MSVHSVHSADVSPILVLALFWYDLYSGMTSILVLPLFWY